MTKYPHYDAAVKEFPFKLQIFDALLTQLNREYPCDWAVFTPGVERALRASYEAGVDYMLAQAESFTAKRNLAPPDSDEGVAAGIAVLTEETK